MYLFCFLKKTKWKIPIKSNWKLMRITIKFTTYILKIINQKNHAELYNLKYKYNIIENRYDDYN